MTLTVDTSIWISLFRDMTGSVANTLRSAVGNEVVVMTRPVLMEVLQGCRDDIEWKTVEARVSAFPLIEFPDALWKEAARLNFDLRRDGKTIRSSVDCLIAQNCLQSNCTLLHNDRDFDVIATIRPLKHIRLDLSTPSP